MTPPRITLLLATALLAFGCTDPTEPLASIARPAAVASARNDVLPGRYLVVFRGEQVPPDFNATVAALGGTVDNSLDDIGVATVSGLTAEGALSLAGQDGVKSVEPRMTGSFNEDSDVAADDDGAAAVTPALALRDALAAPTGDLRSPTMALHYSWQWNLLATREMCEAYGNAFLAAVNRITKERSDYLSAAIDLEWQMPNLKWMLGSKCDLSGPLERAEANIRAVADSDRLRNFAVTLGELKAVR